MLLLSAISKCRHVISSDCARVCAFQIFSLRFRKLSQQLTATRSNGALLTASGEKLPSKISINSLNFHKNATTRGYSGLVGSETICNAEEADSEVVTITYVDRNDERHVIRGKVGDNVMYLAQRHDLDVEGACEASLACCTCHVYVKDEYYDMLGEPSEEEEDMLDLAPFLQENSRLSCQIILSKEIDGIEVRLPSATRNFYVDGHKPKHH